MSPTAEIAILGRIASDARRLASITKPLSHFKLPKATSSSANAHLVNIFPPPPSILPDLVALSLSPGIAEKLASIYSRAASQYRDVAFMQYRRAVLARASPIPHSPIDVEKLHTTFASIMLDKYTKTLQGWRDEAISIAASRLHDIAAIFRKPALSHKLTKRSFNQDGVPLLERAFEHNNRPSRSEKRRLARQANMDYKQVNVWFQNRRNRSKKAMSSEPCVMTNHAPTHLPVDLARALIAILDNYTPIVYEPVEELKSDTGLIVSFGPLYSSRPPHAFPVCYPPMCPYDPFPVMGATRKFLTPWTRIATAPRKIDPVPATSDVLASLENMHLNDEEHGPLQDGYCGPVVGFAIVPPRAPLSALLRTLPCCKHDIDAESMHHHGYSATAPSENALRPTKSRVRRALRRCKAVFRTYPGTERSPGYSSEPSDVPATTRLVRRWLGRTSRPPTRNCPDIAPDDTTLPVRRHPCDLDSIARSSPRGPRQPSRPYPTGKLAKRRAREASVGEGYEGRPVSPWTATSASSGSSSPSRTSSGSPCTPSKPRSMSVRLPAISRALSLSSVRSFSSMSSSSSESEGPATPPLLETSLPAITAPDHLSTFGLYTDHSDLTSSSGDPAEVNNTYLGYSLTSAYATPSCGDVVSTFLETVKCAPIASSDPYPPLGLSLVC